MAKAKTYYSCRECGYQSSSWLGRCPQCGSWSSFDEEVQHAPTPTARRSSKASSHPKRIDEIQSGEERRMATQSAEFDRVLGGGIVQGSLLLIGGEPGIGKSTLLLQTALAMTGVKVLYVSGEESEQQIKMRADRIAAQAPNEAMQGASCYVVSETSTAHIFEHIEAVQPDLVVVDSIQTVSTDRVESSAGSVAQIRECTAEFQHYAKESGVPVLLVGHITKDGTIAGPKVMEHIVDAVLLFEGDKNYGFRLLRAQKNRFGSTSEIGIFEMGSDGLRQVSNPSQFLLSQRDETLSGAAVAATMEGVRPMFVEVQSLVSSAVYGTPQRNANGFDLRRMNMLLAVLEKRCGFKLGAKDVFLNIAGGLRVSDPAIDLAVAMSILSSNIDVAIPPTVCFAAELGLSGEVRPVSRLEMRVAEADRMGFERIFVSSYNVGAINRKRYRIEVVDVSVVEEAFRKMRV